MEVTMNENVDGDVKSFEDGMSADLAKNPAGTLKRLLQYLAKQKIKIITIFLSVLISSALTIASPMVMGIAIDTLFNSVKLAVEQGTKFDVNITTMGGILGFLILLYFASSAFKYLEQYIMASVAQTLTQNMRTDFSQKLNKLPLSYFDSHKKGEILSRATNDLEKVADSLQEGLMQLITAVVMIVGAVTMMIIISPLLTLAAVCSITISILITASIAKRSQKYYSNNQKAMGEVNSNIEEAFTGQLVVKAFSKEKDTIESFQLANEKLYEANRKAQFVSYAISPVIRFVNQIGYVLTAVIGGIFATQGVISIGNIQAFIQYVNQSSEPITEASYIINMLQSAIASAERFFEVMDETEEIDEKAGIAFKKQMKGKVNFQHVKFGYQKDTVLMKDINIKLNAGDKIAIVGPTGAGKTTLVNLLMRFYEIQGGKITIDDIDIRSWERGALRTLFGMVLQDTWLFNGSIADNIAYSKENASFEEVVNAAKAARADHFIRTMPQGYHTVLNEDGSNISQGQRQLLTIARAILADPAILILDEATSSVDTRTELEIQNAMKHLMKGRTSFVIAHRLSTIKDADLILVMKDGTIVEQGNHEELLEQEGFYEELYNSQFALKSLEKVI